MKHSIQTNPSQANAYPEPCRGSRVTPQTARKEASRYPSNWSESKALSNKWGRGGYRLLIDRKALRPFALTRTQLYNQSTPP